MSKFKDDARASLRTPLLDKTDYQSPDSNRNRKMYKKSITLNTKFNQISQTPRPPLIPHLKLDQIEQSPRTSNKSSDISLLIIIIILSALQFSIFISTSNSISSPIFSSQIIQDFCVLSWKWQIFLIILFIYGAISHSINKQSKNPSSQPLVSTQPPSDYAGHLKLLFQSSNLDNVISSINLGSLLSSLLSVIASFCLFYSCRYLSFSTCALISNLTSIIPYYLVTNTRDKALNLIRLISPLFIIIGIAILLIDLSSFVTYLSFFICLFAVFWCQLINQMSLSAKIKEEQPFHLLLCTYINYVLISTVIILGIQLAYWSFSIHLLFGWLLNWRLALRVVIGFGLFGAGHLFLSMFVTISLQNKTYIKMIKYIEIPLNDLVGVVIFSLYQSPISMLYCISFIQIFCAIGLLEFYGGLLKYLNKKIN